MSGFLETALLVDTALNPIMWHEPLGRSSVYLPDSRALWEAIWENRDRLLGIAHTHPGAGFPRPSQEDLSTFRAVDQALGKVLLWWIVTSDKIEEYSQFPLVEGEYATSSLCQRRERPVGIRHTYDWKPESFVMINKGQQPEWVEELRARSLGLPF